MAGLPRSPTEAQQAFTFTRRAMFLGGAQATLAAILGGRMAWLSIVENQKYALLAESNRVNFTLIPPRRGWIVDRNGKPMALNRTAFRVDIIPDRLINKDKTLRDLQRLLGLGPDDLERIERELKHSSGFRPVQVAENIPWEQFAAISIRANEFPGVAPAQSFSRFYPDGGAVGHLLGYVGSASAKQYEETKDPLLITPGFKVGKEGLERTVDPILRGKPGAKRTEVTASGKLVRELASRADVSGQTAKLTIDAGLQAYAARRLGLESGSAVFIDCTTGGILALASMPSFDPNSFSDGIGSAEWAMLRGDDHVPLLNKSVQGLYPPGSTVKPVAALALLRHGVDPDETVYCGGGYRLGNRTFKCLGRHGSISMANAIMKSCNTYFYSMGRRLGYDKIAEVGRELGLGQEFDLPLTSQRYGTVPDSAWKLRKLKKEWSQADTLNSTIGQGFVQTSPLQLAVMAARIASGRMLHPKLLAGQHKPDSLLKFPPEHLAIVREGMNRVVNSAGTGARSRLPLAGVKMAGKTGTAQVRKIEGAQRGQSGVWKYRDHGLFVCFAPVDAPLYAAAVVIEHGLGGARAAAPVARDCLTYMYEPAKAMATLEALERGWGGNIIERSARMQAKLKNPPPEQKPLSPEEEAAKAEAEAAAKAKAESDAETAKAESDAAAAKAKATSAETVKAKAPSPPPVTEAVRGQPTSPAPSPPDAATTPILIDGED